MSKVLLGKALVPASIAMAGLLLAGCGSMTTYGTGKTPAAQTIEDIGGIVSFFPRIDLEQSLLERGSTPHMAQPNRAGPLREISTNQYNVTN